MSGAGYIACICVHARFAGFGALMAFLSSVGQTYFIGIFGPGFQREFGLGHTARGNLHMIGTLTSALLLPFTGKLIDRFDPRGYSLGAFLALAFACVLTALLTGPIMLGLAVFALRQSGQGLCSHVAQTSMARYFEAERLPSPPSVLPPVLAVAVRIPVGVKPA